MTIFEKIYNDNRTKNPFFFVFFNLYKFARTPITQHIRVGKKDISVRNVTQNRKRLYKTLQASNYFFLQNELKWFKNCVSSLTEQ